MGASSCRVGLANVQGGSPCCPCSRSCSPRRAGIYQVADGALVHARDATEFKVAAPAPPVAAVSAAAWRCQRCREKVGARGAAAAQPVIANGAATDVHRSQLAQGERA